MLGPRKTGRNWKIRSRIFGNVSPGGAKRIRTKFLSSHCCSKRRGKSDRCCALIFFLITDFVSKDFKIILLVHIHQKPLVIIPSSDLKIALNL